MKEYISYSEQERLNEAEIAARTQELKDLHADLADEDRPKRVNGYRLTTQKAGSMSFPTIDTPDGHQLILNNQSNQVVINGPRGQLYTNINPITPNKLQTNKVLAILDNCKAALLKPEEAHRVESLSKIMGDKLKQVIKPQDEIIDAEFEVKEGPAKPPSAGLIGYDRKQ